MSDGGWMATCGALALALGGVTYELYRSRARVKRLRGILDHLGPRFVKAAERAISARSDVLADEVANELVKRQDEIRNSAAAAVLERARLRAKLRDGQPEGGQRDPD